MCHEGPPDRSRILRVVTDRLQNAWQTAPQMPIREDVVPDQPQHSDDTLAEQERAAHRGFAVAFATEVRDLLDAGLGPASPEDRRRHALYTTYASTRHWLRAGTPAHLTGANR